MITYTDLLCAVCADCFFPFLLTGSETWIECDGEPDPDRTRRWTAEVVWPAAQPSLERRPADNTGFPDKTQLSFQTFTPSNTTQRNLYGRHYGHFIFYFATCFYPEDYFISNFGIVLFLQLFFC